MAPMSLVTYQEVRPWARAIREKVITRLMPPWHLDKTVGIQDFKNDVSLSDAQIDTIVKWVDAGAPLGNPADLPEPVQWPADDVWRVASEYGLGELDLMVRSTPWTQEAEGQDQWYQPVVDTGLTEDRWVKAIEVRPSVVGRRIVHHVVTSLIQEESPDDFDALVDVPARAAISQSLRSGRSATCSVKTPVS